MWCPTLPVQFTLRPPRGSPIAQPLQVAFNGLLRWALQLPGTTRVEFLYILGNLPPPTVLVAKQLVRYVASLRAPPPPQLGAPPPPTPGRPRHATRVWDAILAAEAPLDDPLDVAPVYWQQMVEARGAAPTIADLYTETRELLMAGLEDSAATFGAVGRAGTLGVWRDIVAHLYAAGDTRHTLPSAWEDATPDLRGT